LAASSAVISRYGTLPSTLRVLATIEVPMWPGHDDGDLDVRRVDAKVFDQRLRESLHRELGGAVRRVRRSRSERSPEPFTLLVLTM